MALSQRRLEANRRNAARSTGPRTADGKARVARNAIKHGFFVARERWTPDQHRDFETTLEGLRDDFRPQSALEESCVRIMAESYVRMASVLRYENIAALREHQRIDRDFDERIAAAGPPEAARLRAQRSRLRRAGLWKPTIPGEREAMAIMRYLGRIDRTIHAAASQLKTREQTHFSASSTSAPGALRRTSNEIMSSVKSAKTNPLYAWNCGVFGEAGDTPPGREARPALISPSRFSHRSDGENRAGQLLSRKKAREATEEEDAKTNPLRASREVVLRLGEGPQAATPCEVINEKTNPLSSMFTGNRHQRRRAKALARRR